MSHLWQHPFVNVFKHFEVQSWKKASKEGEVTAVMDKTMKGTVYRITGSIPAGNFILIPKTSSQSLGLTGRYMYLCFKPIPTKYFVVHIDVATQDGLIVRISFSNLFKEFKSTSTWLQFPFICNASKGSICSHTSMVTKEHIGPAPASTRWTVLCLDFQYILSMYLNRRYSYMKSIKLCANMLVKNIYTSDMDYEPGISFDQVKKTGLTLKGLAPMPREMSFPLPQSQKWRDIYDLIRFPSDSTRKPFDSIQYSKTGSEPDLSKNSLGPVNLKQPRRVMAKTVHANRPSQEKLSLIHHATQEQSSYRRSKPVSELPRVGVDENGDISIEQTLDGEVHVYAHPTEPIVIHQLGSKTKKSYSTKVTPPTVLPAKKDTYKSLSPDPILKMRRIVGFGGATTKDALWAGNGTEIVYPCHAVVVSMQVSNGHQRFFVGHTDKVSCISLNGECSLLASGQTGPQSVVRVWNYHTGEFLAIFKTHVHSMSSLSMSNSGNVLCGVGKDGHGKNMVVIWNTEDVSRGRQVTVLAKAHTDVDVARMRIAAFDDTRMVSCGRDNIRLWRVKDGSLRSAPVNLGEHHLMEFTDCCFEAGYEATKDPLDRLVYACTKSGHIFEVDYRKVSISHVRRLLPVNNKEKQTFSSGPGIAINSMSVNEAFCVTGSDDGFLRLWPLTFREVYLEAEHEGPVTAVDISGDGSRILAGTSTGNLGILDITTNGYTTVMRSHTSRILGLALDPIRRHLATVSEDHTIRIWDLDTMQQLYDFTAPRECPCTITYHPHQQVFACGFESGTIRVFSVETTSMLAEHKQHRGKVTGLCYCPSAEYLYSSGSLGSLAIYDASDNQYQLLRLLGNTVARGEGHGPEALAVSPDGRFLAFVGPSDFTVSVVDGRSLDEVMRIDITNLTCTDNIRNVVDTAVRVKYAPANTKQLLVTTANNKLLKFDAWNGKIVAEIDNIHRSGCTALDVSGDGRHLATAGDKVIKIWDYHMRLDLNFQVFIGHSETISKLVFTPDSLGFLSIGEAIFMWDFLAKAHDVDLPEGRTKCKNYFTGEEEEYLPYKSPVPKLLPSDRQSDIPRSTAPQPTTLYAPGQQVADISAIDKATDDILGEDIVSTASDKEELLAGTDPKITAMDNHPVNGYLSNSPSVRQHQSERSTKVTPTKKLASKANTPTKTKAVCSHAKPTANKHYCHREKKYPLAQRRYTAPPNLAGLKLKAVIGYNGNGRNNMVWHADTGVFVYTSGCTVILEDLSSGKQHHFLGHTEEVSVIALQHDCQILASASSCSGQVKSEIRLWDVTERVCKKTLVYHEYDVVALSYSRDDRFLISMGDYHECSILIWSTTQYTVLCSTQTSVPMLDVKWDPYTFNEFASVGENGTLLFWLLDETGKNYSLSVHEAEVPKDLIQLHHVGSSQVDFTCLEYAGDSILYVGTSNGKISAWDTRQNTCFIHWEADLTELEVLISHSGRLISGSSGRSLKMWSVLGVDELRYPGDGCALNGDGITMDDEMNLDGAIISAAFDETLDLGVVGTTAGTLWYINWTERASIRLVSGHGSRINSVALCDDSFMATCSDDGLLRVWSLADKEQTLQFQVIDQVCNCMAFSPTKPEANTSKVTLIPGRNTSVISHQTKDAKRILPNIVAGYSDGTVRMFELNKVEMVLKMQPHAMAVTAIGFSADGKMILSGGCDGLVAISSPTTGMTVRVITDHKGAPITCIDVAFASEQELEVSAPLLWLAASADRRVSVWSADWSKDYCELIDWLTFPAPAFTPDGTVIRKGDKSYFSLVPPSLAKFSHEEQDTIIYTGYGMHRQLQFYSLSQRKVLRTITLTHWATSLEVSPVSALIAVGNNERLLKLIDYFEGSFQDFTGHDDAVNIVHFSPSGKYLLSVSYNEIMQWEVLI